MYNLLSRMSKLERPNYVFIALMRHYVKYVSYFPRKKKLNFKEESHCKCRGTSGTNLPSQRRKIINHRNETTYGLRTYFLYQ